MSILLIIDWCGESESEFYEVSGDAESIVSKLNGQYINSVECSLEMKTWFDSLYYDGERLPMSPDYRKLNLDEPCGPFSRIVQCGMLP